MMRVLMLVATSVATDTRVLREAITLTEAGHEVHIIGRSVPDGYTPPAGIEVSSVGTSSVFRAEGGASLSQRRLPPHLRLARWLLLPRHRQSAYGRWAAGAIRDGAQRRYDVVHAHDYTALAAGATLARRRGVPYIYDTHELWSGRPREYRPTPLLDRREQRIEARLGAQAVAVITVGEGVAEALRARYQWPHVSVVRNTFPAVFPTGADDAAGATRSRGATGQTGPDHPRGLVYAGRLAAYRELETIAAASRELNLPITLIGPADGTWLASFERGLTTIEPPCPADEVDSWLVRAGLVLVTHSDRWENHRLAMPNKLFHAIRAGAPVIATDVGELAKVVRAHGIGTLYPPGDVAGLVRAVHEAIARYPELRDAVRQAAPALSWDADAARLLAIYGGITGTTPSPARVHEAAPARVAEPVSSSVGSAPAGSVSAGSAPAGSTSESMVDGSLPASPERIDGG